MGAQNVVEFWSSILSESVFVDQLESVMDIRDSEVRTFKLLCKTLFLLVMEIKNERDEIKSTGMSNSGVCRLCQDKLSGKDSEVEREEETIDHKRPDEKSVWVRKVASKGCRSLLKPSPLKVIFGSRKGNEDEERKDGGSKEEDSPASPEVVVPETMSLDEHPLHVNVEKRKMLMNHIVMVPETLPLNFTQRHEDDTYNNEDFFDATGTCKENISPENQRNDELEEDVDIGSETPVKGTSNTPESEGGQSPVLGKQTKAAVQKAKGQNDQTDISKKLDFENFENPPKAVLEPTEPDSSTKNNIKIEVENASMPRYSPLVFTNTPSLMQDDSDLTSPSLLPGVTYKNSQSERLQDKGSPLMAILSKNTHSPTSSRAKRSLQKSASSFNLSPPKEKLRRMQRHHTTDKQPKSMYEMVFEPPGPKNKKIYKQTKISAEVFQQKNKAPGAKGDEEEDDESLLAAMKESLRSKAIEDMMRKKEKALQALGDPLEDEAGVPSVEQAATAKKGSRSPVKGKAKKINSPIKLPKLSPTKHAHSSPSKEFKSPPKFVGNRSLKRRTQDHSSSPSKSRSSPRKHSSLTNRNPSVSAPQPGERRSPRKRPQQSPPEKKKQSPVKKRKVEEGKAGDSGSKEEQVLGLDQLLEKVNTNPSSGEGQSAKSPARSSGLRKISLRKNKREFFDNSFDIVPEKNEEPSYAYLGDVVRKKDARKQLQGWGCRECEKWYENQDLDPEEKKVCRLVVCMSVRE
ncbi:serine/arginine repetitive matrix protein 1-like isoform X2 [Penaeus monodon]|uniref:serine/arginine repetitive matrix protein 1-like isoform X2 n=1 Tax=Penaeus monodon TaxID=6687 RepID=UPI0018A79B6B|nr:serine/arginine repetitive matrix protein 1-like isoform X2 [Penaeus monodon]